MLFLGDLSEKVDMDLPLKYKVYMDLPLKYKVEMDNIVCKLHKAV